MKHDSKTSRLLTASRLLIASWDVESLTPYLLLHQTFFLRKNVNNFFISKIDTLRKVPMSLDPTAAEMSIPDLDSILTTYTAPMDTMTPANVEEVTKIIKESYKATYMLDPMPTSLVKEIAAHLALYITNIVDMTLSTGIFPSKLKSAIVLPLLKKQNLDSESFKNYRPVSNLPFLSKVIE